MSVLSQEWTEKLEAWRNSGLSIAAWCRQNDEGYHRFLYWRRRLKPQRLSIPGKFVEFSLGHGGSPLRLECNGIFLHVGPGFDAGLLTEILVVLKQV